MRRLDERVISILVTQGVVGVGSCVVTACLAVVPRPIKIVAWNIHVGAVIFLKVTRRGSGALGTGEVNVINGDVSFWTETG